MKRLIYSQASEMTMYRTTLLKKHPERDRESFKLHVFSPAGGNASTQSDTHLVCIQPLGQRGLTSFSMKAFR